MKYQTRRMGRAVNQSAVPSRPKSFDAARAQGLNLRGVITRVYTLDDPDHPYADQQPVALYCDVLCYSSMSGLATRFLPNVLIPQHDGGIHSGSVRKPRAAGFDITADTMNLEKGTNVSDVDGDHVIVAFLDDNFNQPFVLRHLPHPSANVGNESLDAGHRTLLKDADGDPTFYKHHGSYYGIADNGDFIVDLTRANLGELESDGTEPDPPEDGTVGNGTVRLPKGSKVRIEIDGTNNVFEFSETAVDVQLDGGATFKFELKDADAKLTIGDGAVKAAIADHLKTMWEDFVNTAFPKHTHIDGFGGTGPVNSGPVTPWDSAIESGKLTFPDG